MPVFLVRHAHALPRSEWRGDDSLRELSERGRRQSDALVEVLVEFKPQRILSSPYLRCVDTVAPLASALGLAVEPADVLAEGSGKAAYRLVRDLVEQDVVLCSHGDVIPGVLENLSTGERVDIGKTPRCEKASIWVLQGRKGHFAKAAYLKPPRID